MRAGHSMLAALAVAALASSGCDGPGSRRVRVDEELLAALGLAQAYQHQAEELAASGDRPAAIAKVRLVLEVPFPAGAPEGEDVRLDAHGSVAELLLAEGDEEGAEAAVRAGLRESTRTSYFKARLHGVRGRVLRARAEQLRDAGDEAGAQQISREAIAAFEQSIEINRAVLGLGPGRDGEGGEP